MNRLLNNKFFIIYLAPFFLGSISILSFSPYNLTFINFFSFSSLLYLIFLIKKKTQSIYIKKKSTRYFFYVGCSFGFGFFLFGNYWIVISLTHDEIFKILIPFALIIIPLFLSLFFGLAVFFVGPYSEKKLSFVLLFSIVFSLFEFLRGNILTGFPWNLIGYTWSWSRESIQILSLIGTYAFSLFSITCFCIPFLFFQKKIKIKNITIIFFLLIILISNYFFGAHILNKDIYKFDKAIKVKIISPNFSLIDYKTKSEVYQLKRLIKISNPNKNEKTIFIWPEGIFYESRLDDITKYKKMFTKNFTKNHLIVLGINSSDNVENKNKNLYYNSLVILNHKLETIYKYNKINLVPFGEFLPFEDFFNNFGIKKITEGYNSFSAGNEREILNLGNLFNEKLILPLICYEIIYSGKLKKNNQLPDLVINISEDAWFGSSIGPYQHFTKAVYRSVEEGVFIARSANSGISAFIDPNGRSIKSLKTGESGNISINFPHFNEPTLFSIYKNKIFYLIILLYIFLFLFLKKIKI